MAEDSFFNIITGHDPAFVQGDSNGNLWRLQSDGTNGQLLVTKNGTTVASFGGAGTGTAASGAVTLNANEGVVTSESLSTAAGSTYTLTITNSDVTASSICFASVFLGSSTTGMPVVTTVTPAAGSLTVVVQNIHASAALNGTIKVAFKVFA